MKIRIVVSYVERYRRGHGVQFVPPVTGIHLAAITPPEHEVEVVHEQARPVPVDADVDVVAISFFTGFAARAYALCDAYRALGVKVVVGGPHVSYWLEEALAHADVVVTGEAETVWPEVLRDLERGNAQRVYRGSAASLDALPTPRYDLLEDAFVVRRVLQATRGCPFTCTFCTVPEFNPGFRVRPIADVVRDVTAPIDGHAKLRAHLPWNKVAWFWDDNLLVKRAWAKELLAAMTGLDRYWLTQASIDIVKDRALLDAMERSGCIGIFLGIESLDDAELAAMKKRQNRATEYRDAIARLHDRGICVMAGFISGAGDQSEATVVATAERLQAIGVDVPFLSILTPFRGTPLYDTLFDEGRLLEDRAFVHYNGYNVAFRPAKMSPDALLRAHREQWRRAFAPAAVAERALRGARTLRPHALMLSLAMNGFYGAKRLTNNAPRVFDETATIAHARWRERPSPVVALSKKRSHAA